MLCPAPGSSQLSDDNTVILAAHADPAARATAAAAELAEMKQDVDRQARALRNAQSAQGICFTPGCTRARLLL
jgi:hypothetical protein